VYNPKIIIIQGNLIPFFLSLRIYSNIINNILIFSNRQWPSIFYFNFFFSLRITVCWILIWINILLTESLIGYQTPTLQASIIFAYALFILREIIFFF